jgi:hypothetical protein
MAPYGFGGVGWAVRAEEERMPTVMRVQARVVNVVMWGRANIFFVMVGH